MTEGGGNNGSSGHELMPCRKKKRGYHDESSEHQLYIKIGSHHHQRSPSKDESAHSLIDKNMLTVPPENTNYFSFILLLLVNRNCSATIERRHCQEKIKKYNVDEGIDGLTNCCFCTTDCQNHGDPSL